MELLSTQQQQLQEVLDEGYKTLQRELSTTQEAPDQRGDSVSLIVDNMVSTVCIRSMGDFSAVQNKLEMALASKAEMSEVLRLFKAEVEEIREFSITERGLMHSIVAKSGSPEVELVSSFSHSFLLAMHVCIISYFHNYVCLRSAFIWAIRGKMKVVAARKCGLPKKEKRSFKVY
uniref:Uncharacterized protein n=1 Tax=Octactis speculum TaxID=3111310 RepID=A0A7S2AV46_9STRA